MSDERCDLCGRPTNGRPGSCQAQVNKTGESPGGDIMDCDGQPHELDVREYLRMKRDMPGIIDTLQGLAAEVGAGTLDPARAMIAVSALAIQLRRDHIDNPIEAKLNCRHVSVYECAGCNALHCMACDEPAESEQVKTAVRWCPTCRAAGIEAAARGETKR